MRKLVSLLLALMLVLGMFAAASAAEYPIVSEPISVTGVFAATGRDVETPRLTWTTIEEVTGIHVDWIKVETGSLPVFMAAGEWPDFFHDRLDSTYINDYGILGNMFVDYSDYLDIMPNLVQTFEDYPDSRKAITEVNGAMYQLPSIEVSATCTQARVYYREDVLEANGLAVPTTTEEFYETLKALKEANDGAAPLVVNPYSSAYFEPWMFSAFGPGCVTDFEDDGTGKVVYNRISDQYKLYLEYMHRLYAEGLLHEEYLTLDGTTQLSLAQEGLTVFMEGTAHSLVEADFPSGHVDLNVMTPLTSEYDDERVVMGQLTGSCGGFAINAQSEYVEEICKMLDIFYATEEVVPGTGLYGIAGCYGPEGGMWRFTDDTHDFYEFILPEDFEGTTTDYQYGHVILNNCGRVDALSHAVTSTPGNAQSRQLGFVNNLIPYHQDINLVWPGSRLKFTDDEQFVLDNNFLEINTKADEMRSQFITGVADIDNEWDSYVALIESMGLEDVLAVYQASYDRWLG